MKPAWMVVGILGCVVLTSTGTEAAPKKKNKTARTEPSKSAKGDEAADFDKQAAVTAITEVSLQKCKVTNATTGDGHVMITFAPTGVAQNAKIDKGPWVGTPVAKCMAKEFRKAKVPAFKGDAVTVGKSFHFE
jgi:hypothetical protein